MMNRGLGSIMGYRGGGMPVARFQEGGVSSGDVEEFNRLIRTYDLDNWKIAGEIATNAGFTPEQVLTYLNDVNIFPEFGGGVTLETVQSFVPQTPFGSISSSG
jgi:hypothetical protein